jgi:hypothetical protein
MRMRPLLPGKKAVQVIVSVWPAKDVGVRNLVSDVIRVAGCCPSSTQQKHDMPPVSILAAPGSKHFTSFPLCTSQSLSL